MRECPYTLPAAAAPPAMTPRTRVRGRTPARSTHRRDGLYQLQTRNEQEVAVHGAAELLRKILPGDPIHITYVQTCTHRARARGAPLPPGPGPSTRAPSAGTTPRCTWCCSRGCPGRPGPHLRAHRQCAPAAHGPARRSPRRRRHAPLETATRPLQPDAATSCSRRQLPELGAAAARPHRAWPAMPCCTRGSHVHVWSRQLTCRLGSPDRDRCTAPITVDSSAHNRSTPLRRVH